MPLHLVEEKELSNTALCTLCLLCALCVRNTNMGHEDH